MKQPIIQYRPFQPSDYQALEEVIRKTWDYDRLASPKTAQLMAKVFLASCLANQTFTCVAVSDGEPVGIIMGKNIKKHRHQLRYLSRLGLSMVQIALSKEARRIAKIFKEADQIDGKLFKDTNFKFDGELAFFAVCGNQRGTGIGKQLYEHFLEYAASENLETFFLFTDTTCNYGFYEHQGLQRMADRSLRIPEIKEDMDFYLYGQV